MGSNGGQGRQPELARQARCRAASSHCAQGVMGRSHAGNSHLRLRSVVGHVCQSGCRPAPSLFLRSWEQRGGGRRARELQLDSICIVRTRWHPARCCHGKRRAARAHNADCTPKNTPVPSTASAGVATMCEGVDDMTKHRPAGRMWHSFSSRMTGNLKRAVTTHHNILHQPTSPKCSAGTTVHTTAMHHGRQL